jgi:hypothetical protein
MATRIDRERLEAMVYHGLWALRDLDPDGEPTCFRLTRLDLHDRLDGYDEGEPAPLPPSGSRGGHLAVVR